MEITLETVSEAIKTNPELANGLLLQLVETEKGKDLLAKSAKAHFDANIGSKVSEIYNSIDNDIFEVLGVRKQPEVKTYDFLKSNLAELKKLKETVGSDDKIQKISTLENEIKKLKEVSTSDEFWKKSHTEAVLKFENDKKEYQAKIAELEKGNTLNLVNNDLSMGLAGLEFNPNIPKNAIDALTSTIKESILKNSKIEEGKVVYLKEDGTPWLDSGYNPITSKGIFAEKLKDVLNMTPNGGGSAPTGTKGEIISVTSGDAVTKKVVLDKTQFSTKTEFFNVLEKTLFDKGITKDNKEFAELRDNAYAEYEVEKLERV